VAVEHHLRDGADIRGDDRQPGEHRLEHREAEALPTGRVHEQLGAGEPVGHVADAAGEVHRVGHAAGLREVAELSLEAPSLAEDDEHDARVCGQEPGERLDRDVEALLVLEPRDGEDVFDIYTLATGKGINGRPYREW